MIFKVVIYKLFDVFLWTLFNLLLNLLRPFISFNLHTFLVCINLHASLFSFDSSALQLWLFSLLANIISLLSNCIGSRMEVSHNVFATWWVCNPNVSDFLPHKGCEMATTEILIRSVLIVSRFVMFLVPALHSRIFIKHLCSMEYVLALLFPTFRFIEEAVVHFIKFRALFCTLLGPFCTLITPFNVVRPMEST